MTNATNQFGELGERIAARWLERHGYAVLARRWRSGHRDIDLIAERAGIVAFVEVKTRAGLEFGDPVEAVHAQKQRSLVRSAREWIAKSDRPSAGDYRFDVIGVLLRDRTVWVRHVESAFLL
ncbi:MAG: YraN family protein [Gemmatimonadaceae bacterium]|nr:YraN family protein [Gemmatimonadaceae bacterium]